MVAVAGHKAPAGAQIFKISGCAYRYRKGHGDGDNLLARDVLSRRARAGAND